MSAAVVHSTDAFTVYSSICITLTQKCIYGLCLFYGVDDYLRTGLVFYGCYHSVNGMIIYRPVVDRPEMYLFFLLMGQYFQTCCTRPE